MSAPQIGSEKIQYEIWSRLQGVIEALTGLNTTLTSTNVALGVVNASLASMDTRLSNLESAIPTVTTYKVLEAVVISVEATLWTPASGKKFRLMGGVLTVTGAAANVAFKDGNSGSTIFTLPNVLVATPIPFNLGKGILSAAANNNLRALGAALMVLNGVVWGREE